jgi:hypothetical protein
VHHYGLAHHIITDLGSNFNNHQLWEYCENSGIDVRYVSVTHPRANGKVECANGMVLDALKKRLHDAAYSTLQANGTVTIFPGLGLRSYSTR